MCPVIGRMALRGIFARCYLCPVGDRQPSGAAAEVRVLVALDDNHRAYRETIASAIQILRPHAEVESTGLDAFDDRLESFDPQVVVCAHPETGGRGDRAAWVELSLEPMRPTRVRVGSHRFEQSDPTLEALLTIVDEVAEVVRARSER